MAPAGIGGGHEDEDDVVAAELSTEIVLDEDDLEDADAIEDVVPDDLNDVIARLSQVGLIDHPNVPALLDTAAFLKKTVEHDLRATPITIHRRARELPAGRPVGEDLWKGVSPKGLVDNAHIAGAGSLRCNSLSSGWADLGGPGSARART